MDMYSFRTAVDARDEADIEARLEDEVVFSSPVAFKPYPAEAIESVIAARAPGIGFPTVVPEMHERPRGYRVS
ncbi:hypothetical protein [Nocardia nepalensis]|uniref:hypothetical protein n=1 Tax=Nocardia nepalensis TaxID=3375448 RepID=UPI003B66D331